MLPLLFVLSMALLIGGPAALILTASPFWKLVGFVMLAMIFSTLSGEGVFSGKKDAAL